MISWALYHGRVQHSEETRVTGRQANVAVPVCAAVSVYV